jgi:hypothetical protein
MKTGDCVKSTHKRPKRKRHDQKKDKRRDATIQTVLTKILHPNRCKDNKKGAITIGTLTTQREKTSRLKKKIEQFL